MKHGSIATEGLPLSIHHIEFYVSNALQSSHWYCINFGFRRYARKEDRRWSSIAIRNGNVLFIFTTCKEYDEDFVKHLNAHGDSIKDVAFLVDDISASVEHVVQGGGFLQKPIDTVSDNDGFMKTAVVTLPECDVCHTLLSLKKYRGFFLPRYEHYVEKSVLLKSLSVDDSISSTAHSAMKVLLLANQSKTIQITLTEPVPKTLRARSQIQEYLDYNGGAGVQHVAFLVNDIIKTVEKMKKRSVDFIPIPNEYYTNLQARLSMSPIKLEEDFDKIKKLQILVDFDDHGYLLQIFTQPVQDRPTLFFEVIQRNNYTGFGAGNVKALFEAVEKEQEKRGTLYQDL